MAVKAARESFSREDIADILRRNISLFKNEEGFEEFLVELTLYLVEQSESPALEPQDPAMDMMGSSLESDELMPVEPPIMLQGARANQAPRPFNSATPAPVRGPAPIRTPDQAPIPALRTDFGPVNTPLPLPVRPPTVAERQSGQFAKPAFGPMPAQPFAANTPIPGRPLAPPMPGGDLPIAPPTSQFNVRPATSTGFTPPPVSSGGIRVPTGLEVEASSLASGNTSASDPEPPTQRYAPVQAPAPIPQSPIAPATNQFRLPPSPYGTAPNPGAAYASQPPPSPGTPPQGAFGGSRTKVYKVVKGYGNQSQADTGNCPVCGVAVVKGIRACPSCGHMLF